MSLEPALRFFLRYAEARGAEVLVEPDQALVHLPTDLAAALALPQELALTSDAEVAQEGGQMLVIAGHPVLEAAAEHVLYQGDAGWQALSVPASALPDAQALLGRLREFYPVEHGRLDLLAPPEQVYLPLLRVGALITLTGEDRFLEIGESLLDAVACLPLASEVGQRVLSLGPVSAPEPWSVLLPDVAAALEVAQAEIERQAAKRAEELSRQALSDMQEERERARAFYAAQLAQIARRRQRAAEERQRLYDEQAKVTAHEAERRQVEIERKYRVEASVQPYRLHLVLAPALHLELEVRRGDRRYPLACNFLVGAGSFLPLRCPLCGAAQPLVAGREALGCRACQEGRSGQPVPSFAPTAEKTAPAPTAAQVMAQIGQQQAQARPRAHAAAGSGRRPQRRTDPGKARPDRQSERWHAWQPLPPLAEEFFRSVLAGGAAEAPIARHSPLDIALRWFDWRGLHVLLDLPYPEAPVTGARLSSLALFEGHHLSGRVQVGRHKREFSLLTDGKAEKATLWEVLPCRIVQGDRLAPLVHLGHQLIGLDEMGNRFGPPAGIDEVEWTLLARGSERWQLPLLLRAVSLWRRIGRKNPGVSPRATAGALLLLATGQSGLRTEDGAVAASFDADALRTRQAAEGLAGRVPPLAL